MSECFVKLDFLYFHNFSMAITIKSHKSHKSLVQISIHFYYNSIVHKAKKGPRSLNLIFHKHCNLFSFIIYPCLQFKYRFGQNYVSESHWISIWGTLEIINVLFPNLVLLLLIPTVKHWCLMILIFWCSFAKTQLQS